MGIDGPPPSWRGAENRAWSEQLKGLLDKANESDYTPIESIQFRSSLTKRLPNSTITTMTMFRPTPSLKERPRKM